MELRDLVPLDAVLPNLKVSSKKQVLQELAAHAATLTGLDARTITDVVLEREKLGTTGVGQGVAIPHGKLQGLDHLYGVFARLASPVDFESVDEQPVDLVFLLLAPEDAGADHLKALAKVSRLLRNLSTCGKIREADGQDAIHALLGEQEASNAA